MWGRVGMTGGGYMEAYGLTSWWEASFSAEERSFVEERLTPVGSPARLSSGSHMPNVPARVFIRELAGQFRRTIPAEASIRERIEAKADEMFTAAEDPDDTRPADGIFEGRHYTEYVEHVKQLKRDGRLDESAVLLGNLIDVVVAEATAKGWTPAPWYFEQLAIVERKRGDLPGEAAVCARYAALRNADPSWVSKLEARRLKAADKIERAR
jgi:hypothetical protein